MVHDNIKKIRIARGITKRFIAKGIGVTETTYARIENGESKLDVERAKVIAVLLGVSITVFFDKKLTEIVIKEIETALTPKIG